MKKIVLWTYVVLSVCSCGPVQSYYNVDPAFQRYLITFRKLYGTDKNVSIVFSKLEPKILGQCRYSTSTITMNVLNWDKWNDSEHENLVYHELGHCLLLRDHDSIINKSGCPESIMYPFMVWDECYVVHRDEYLVELGENRRDI